MGLDIKIESREKGTWVVCPDGRLDSATAPAFEEKIAHLLVPQTQAFILNLERLNYISSAGLRVIFKIRKVLTAHHGAFIIARLQPQIQKVFEIVNALPNTPIFESEAEADRYLDAMQKKENETPPPSPEV
jgi:anti-anti-sigma factor